VTRLGWLVWVLAVTPSFVIGQAPVSAIRDTLLDNGLQVIVWPSASAPVATLELVFRAGALTQLQSEEEGVPHILEHMLFKTYRRGEGFASDAAEAGAIYNGSTSEESVTYHVTLPSERVERGLQLLGGLVRDPQFNRRALEEESLVVRGELERVLSDPYSVLELEAGRVLWGEAFQRKNAIGNAETIQGASTGLVRDHYRRYYVPGNAALIVSGDVVVSDVLDWAADRFDGWDAGPDPFVDFPTLTIEPLQHDTTLVLDTPSSDVTLAVLWQGPSVSDDPIGTLAADVFSQMFNQATSRAQRRLVDSGVFQLVTMRYTTLEHVGPVSLRARTTPGQVWTALEALGLELAALSDPLSFTEEDLGSAKRTLRVEAAAARESVSDAAHLVADLWAVAGLDFYRAYERGLQAVTLADVRAYVGRYLAGEPRVVAALATEELVGPLRAELDGIVRRWSGSAP